MRARLRILLHTQAQAIRFVLLSPETVALWPVAVALSTALSMISSSSTSSSFPLLQQQEQPPPAQQQNYECVFVDVQIGTQAGWFRRKDNNLPEIMESSYYHFTNHHDDRYYLFAEWASSAGYLFCIILLYMGLVTITNIVACFRFFYAWNAVVGSLQSVDRVVVASKFLLHLHQPVCLEQCIHTERYHQNELPLDKPEHCPICLDYLEDQQWVTSCKEGCANKFHKTCLFQWLQHVTWESDNIYHNTSCPCCRKEMLHGTITKSSSSSTSMLSTTVVAAPRNIVTGNNNNNNSPSAWLSDLSTFMGYYVH